jgi:hypothetical protein
MVISVAAGRGASGRVVMVVQIAAGTRIGKRACGVGNFYRLAFQARAVSMKFTEKYGIYRIGTRYALL